METNIRNARGKHSASGILGIVVHILFPILLGCVTAFYISTVCSFDPVVRANLNGVPVGYVQSGGIFTKAALALETDISDKANIAFDISADVTYEFAFAKDPVYLTDEDCYQLLWDTVSDSFVDAHMLYVDDRQAAAYEDGDMLYSLIGDIKSDLLASGGNGYSSVRISNNLRIEKQLCLKSLLRPVDEINKLLHPLADPEPTSARAVEDSVTAHASAFTAATPFVSDEEELLDPDIDYGINRSAGSADEVPADLTLNYTFINTVSQVETAYYQTQLIEDPESFVGRDTVIAEGENGTKLVVYELSYDADGKLVSKTPLEETILTPASDRIVMVGVREIPAPGPTGTFVWPCATPKGISSGYGWRDCYGVKEFHLGIDLPDEKGSPIWAADGGEIVWAGYTPSYGNSVRIQHADNTMTVYAHLSKILVSVGDVVHQGQEIGKMGNTGMSYGSHLHFEVRFNGTTDDPVKFLPPRDFRG